MDGVCGDVVMAVKDGAMKLLEKLQEIGVLVSSALMY